MAPSPATAVDRLRSWHVIVAGLLVQSAVGVWVLSGVPSETEPLGEALTLFVGGALLALVGIAAVFLLPALWMLYVGRYRVVAIGILIIVGVAFLAALRGSPAVWPLPTFLAVAAVLTWRERSTEGGVG